MGKADKYTCPAMGLIPFERLPENIQPGISRAILKCMAASILPEKKYPGQVNGIFNLSGIDFR
jgi:hypothetical protein